MIQSLSQYKPGQIVRAGCYGNECEKMDFLAELGPRKDIHPNFTGAERCCWAIGTPMLSFKLTEQQSCSMCGEQFVSVIIAQEEGKEPIIIGYGSGC